ncbi:MAG: phosphopantetheine-binding protein [Dehalococcoidia bacterium]|nr:phosphopantetheine-binding protein [Dehalococcoidia bacterium]
MTTENILTVEETLRNIVKKITRKEDVVLTPTTTFKELGADSLDVVQILVALEEAFDIELVDEDLKSLNNMGAFIGYVKKKVAEKKK